MAIHIDPQQKYVYQVVIYAIIEDPTEPGVKRYRAVDRRMFGTASTARAWRTINARSSYRELVGEIYRVPLDWESVQTIPNTKREAILELD